jgi:hypothetical protein
MSAWEGFRVLQPRESDSWVPVAPYGITDGRIPYERVAPTRSKPRSRRHATRGMVDDLTVSPANSVEEPRGDARKDRQ